MKDRKARGISTTEIAFVVLVLAIVVVSVGYVDSTQGNTNTISNLEAQVKNLEARVNSSATTSIGNTSLPVMNQAPTIRTFRETWYLSPSAHQDRFDPSSIVVNQGDTIQLTLIDNDTVAHDFVIGPPYNLIINATVPGLIDDLTGQKFTTPAKNNSPGVLVKGTPGNVSATYSFLANYSGIFEFVCTYHAVLGMIGYLVVLPNQAYSTTTPSSSSSTTSSTGASPAKIAVSIVPGAGTNTSSRGYGPDSVIVVLGVNSTIEWTNNDNSPHTVTANNGSLFYSGNMAQGAKFDYTFTKPGVYLYHCTYHPWMTGTVTVRAGS